MLVGTSVIINGASAAVNQNSVVLDTSHVLSLSIHTTTTGTSTGTISVQASNDVDKPVVNWSPVPTFTSSVTAAGSYLIPKFDVCYAWMRIVFTATNAAAGTVTVKIKTIGQ